MPSRRRSSHPRKGFDPDFRPRFVADVRAFGRALKSASHRLLSAIDVYEAVPACLEQVIDDLCQAGCCSKAGKAIIMSSRGSHGPIMLQLFGPSLPAFSSVTCSMPCHCTESWQSGAEQLKHDGAMGTPAGHGDAFEQHPAWQRSSMTSSRHACTASYTSMAERSLCAVFCPGRSFSATCWQKSIFAILPLTLLLVGLAEFQYPFQPYGAIPVQGPPPWPQYFLLMS